jgi:hypothetical protein
MNDPKSFLEMSDEELMNAPPPKFEEVAETAETTTQTTGAAAEETDETDKTAEVTAPAAGALAKPDDEADDEGDKDGDKPSAKPAVKTTATDTPEVEKTDAEKPPVADDNAEKPAEQPAINYEAEYKRLLAPFKANGRDIQVNNVDDAVALMQMGANYNKKMAALKPNLKLMKVLENNGLLSEEKIDFLVDLSKKDPGAISKLVKESGVDPMDLDAEKASAYKRTAYAVDDREMELDTVLDDLQGSPTYTRTLDVVSNKWDVASKQTVSQAPQLLKVLNDHMASGIYDLISTEIERERLFGRLNGLSDIEAYKQTGDAIQARGGFNHLVKDQGKAAPKAQEVVPPKPKVVEDDKLKDKRRAASSTKTVGSSSAEEEFNPLAMSDAEFSKRAKPRFA